MDPQQETPQTNGDYVEGTFGGGVGVEGVDLMLELTG